MFQVCLSKYEIYRKVTYLCMSEYSDIKLWFSVVFSDTYTMRLDMDRKNFAIELK